MKKISTILVFVFMLTALVAPTFSFAQVQVDSDNKGLVPCGRDLNSDGTIKNPCQFEHVLILINKVIQFVLFKMVVPISAIMFAYAGFLLVTSGGAEEKRSSAKRIFTDVALGLIIAIAAWLIISTILTVVGYKWDRFGF